MYISIYLLDYSVTAQETCFRWVSWDFKSSQKSGELDKYGNIQTFLVKEKEGSVKDGDFSSHSEGSAKEEEKSALWIRGNSIQSLKEDGEKVTGMSF